MNSRETILGRVQRAIAGGAIAGGAMAGGAMAGGEKPPRPVMPALWPEVNLSLAEMAERFEQELVALRGELAHCADMASAREKLTALLRDVGAERIGAHDRPLSRDLASEMAPERIEWGDAPRTPMELEGLSAGLVEAEYLLADTGTCMVVGETAHHRLMCYLPPLCIVVAKADRLRPNMPALWDDITRRSRDGARGEYVFITGPSRTADIEKVLILGVHGPKRVVVLLIDAETPDGKTVADGLRGPR